MAALFPAVIAARWRLLTPKPAVTSLPTPRGLVSCCVRTHGYRNTAGLRVGPMNRASSEVEDDGNGDGYWCVVCGRFLPASGGVVVHDDVPHPDNMSFDDGDNPQ